MKDENVENDQRQQMGLSTVQLSIQTRLSVWSVAVPTWSRRECVWLGANCYLLLSWYLVVLLVSVVLLRRQQDVRTVVLRVRGSHFVNHSVVALLNEHERERG